MLKIFSAMNINFANNISKSANKYLSIIISIAEVSIMQRS